MTVAPDRTAPLSGLKVLELGLAMAGPYAAMTLADYGATVIKVERIGEGDDSRHWPPYFHGQLGYYFASANRGKRSIALDLKSAEGVQIVKRLAAEADIVVDNFRTGVLDRLGVGYESLSRDNPRLIYCAISGFGASGPMRDAAANDLFMQAFSGGMSITGEPGRSPAKMAISVADLGGALFGVIGILMALEARHRTGRGQKVETSLLEGQIAMLSYHLTNYFATGRVPQATGSGSGIGVPYQAFPAQDGWLVIAVFNQRMWRDFCAAVERPEWIDDPRFVDVNARVVHRDTLIPLIEAVIGKRPVADWETIFAAANVPSTRVNDIGQIVTHEQVLARDMIMPLDVPGIGPIQLAGRPVKFGGASLDPCAPPPNLGADTCAILGELGFAPDAIDDLLARGIAGSEQAQ